MRCKKSKSSFWPSQSNVREREVIAHQTKEEQASANELTRQRMAQILAEEAAEQRATRLDDARFSAQHEHFETSDQLCSEQKIHSRLRMTEKCQRETASNMTLFKAITWLQSP
ncbi:hypothetical protein TNCV_1317101 [Trichonephila clavipes]|nr:hypothetical protein TNCV_1317101 [Trichonephila clavipes]